MRALVQRVSHASVTIDGRIHGQIGQGFLVLLGITDGDTVDDAVYLADKTVKMRVFTDENDKMNRSLADVGGGLLIVSQFTLTVTAARATARVSRTLPVRRPPSRCMKHSLRAAARAACRSRPVSSARI